MASNIFYELSGNLILFDFSIGYCLVTKNQWYVHFYEIDIFRKIT